MITRIDASRAALWTSETEAALRQCGQFAAYGADKDFLRLYEDDCGNRLSVFEDTAVVSAGGDTAEMRLFLTMDPTVKKVRTDRETASVLAAEWGTGFETEAVMEAPQTPSLHEQVTLVPLREVYPVLLEGFGAQALPPFDVWYADVHHRFRRGLCRAVGVYENDSLVACAMTVAECDTAALIGAVATRLAARGKGYASASVLTLAAMLKTEQKRVLLSPKNQYAHALYERIGFTVIGEWGNVVKPN